MRYLSKYRFPGHTSDKLNVNLQRRSHFWYSRWTNEGALGALGSCPALTSWSISDGSQRHHCIWVMNRNKIKGSGLFQKLSEGTKMTECRKSWSALKKFKSQTNVFSVLPNSLLDVACLFLLLSPFL